MNPIVGDFKQYISKSTTNFKEDLKAIRTGRATPALVENLQVLTYGGSTTLKLREIATLTTEGPQAIVIVPFDPSVTADIEKAIQTSALGLTPATRGNRIIVRVPPLSQEQREKFVKLVGQKAEERKVSIRGQRDDSRRKIKAMFEKKDIAEDAKFRIEKEIDNATSQAMEEIDKIRELKESEILSV